MSEIENKIALRDAFRRKQVTTMSPEQRLKAMRMLQARAWDLLRANPAGYAHFLKRNFTERANRRVERF